MSFVSKKKWPFFHLLKKVSEGSRRVIFFFLHTYKSEYFLCGLDLLCYSLLCVRPENLSNFQLFSQVSLSSQYIYQIELFSSLEGIPFIFVLRNFFTQVHTFLHRVSCVKFTMSNPFNSQKSTLKRTCTKSHKTLVQFSYEVKWSNGIGRYTRGSIYAHDCMFLGERIFLCIGYFRFMCKCGGSESWYLVSKRQLLVLYLHYKHFPPGISLFGIDRNQRSMK